MKFDEQPGRIIRQEMDAGLSFLDSRPSLHNDIMRQIKGEKKVKKKMSTGLIFALILVLLTGTVAVATSYRGVAWFLGGNAGDALDGDYLVSSLEQYHASKLLHATVVDAYWNGLELSVAYHVSPVDPTHVIRMKCSDPAHDHYAPAEEADILLHEPEFINVTSRIDGGVTRPHSVSCSWIYEEDGSISAMVTFQHYGTSGPEWISIPIFNTEVSRNNLTVDMLHCDPTVLPDPIEAHEHEWEPATCLKRRICTICRRAEGDIGYHDYIPAEDGKSLACATCGKESVWPVRVPEKAAMHPGDSGTFVLAVQLRLSDLGYYSGSFTGVYTDETTAAVKAYQISQGLDADGLCLSATLMLLFPQE